MQVTRQKASTNRLRPLIPAHEVSDLPAWWALLEEMGCKDQTDHPVAKGEAGDHPQGLEPPERESPVQASTSILQGDHLGSSTPPGLLMSRGLLDFHSRLVAHSPVVDAVCHDGLIIDDYFAIAKVPRAEHDCLEPSSSTSAQGSGLRPPGSSIETTAWRGRRRRTSRTQRSPLLPGPRSTRGRPRWTGSFASSVPPARRD